ncbi:MAG TPA: hypothetical protein V6C52_00380 [Coleofasciculaceae cyanobacterium]
MPEKKWVFVHEDGPLEADLETLLQTLDASRQKHLGIAVAIYKANNGTLDSVDLLATAVLNRSMALISGFITLVRNQNFLCAAALLRMQLDNLLRFSAIHHVDNPHDLADEILRGAPLRKIRARDGQKMTDKYLVSKLSSKLPWIEGVYESTSGFVHLSHYHIFSTLTLGEENEEGISVQTALGGNGSLNIDESVYAEATFGMNDITREIFKYLEEWVFIKSNSGIVQQMKALKNSSEVRKDE